MEYQVKDIVREIRVTLDQNMDSAALAELGDADTLSLEEIIESKLVEAVRTVEELAPLWLLGPGYPFGPSIAWNGQEGIGSGYVLLPDNFLRLIAFKMSDWSRAVHEAITPDDPKYDLQSSRFPGISGNPDNPVVALVSRPFGRTLEFYSCTDGQGVSISQATYQPEPRIAFGKIDIPHRVKDAAVWYAAYLVAMIQQQTEQAGALLAVSQSLLQQAR
jgi:hypothetical protein